MDWNHYRFRSLWSLTAPVPAVYRALERIEDYPGWWPQVREVTRVDDTRGLVRIRSLLPFDLVTAMKEGLRDPAAGILEAGLSGDVEGWARWTISRRGDGGSLARYDQEVDVRRPLLRRLAVPGRPLFHLNHTLMMRAGRRGLAAHLEAV
ncbi:SRPBCC family protein [Streptomyces sp. NPDC005931]|uniref:SRPBCC family protein n=1 Tax=Streptomyces sp. NPDC005931 TaxID=3364737 RepID=UPI0036959CED